MDDRTMKKVAMAVELVDGLESARELARNDIQSGEATLKDHEDTNRDRRIAVMKHCAINCKKVIDYLYAN